MVAGVFFFWGSLHSALAHLRKKVTCFFGGQVYHRGARDFWGHLWGSPPKNARFVDSSYLGRLEKISITMGLRFGVGPFTGPGVRVLFLGGAGPNSPDLLPFSFRIIARFGGGKKGEAFKK